MARLVPVNGQNGVDACAAKFTAIVPLLRWRQYCYLTRRRPKPTLPEGTRVKGIDHLASLIAARVGCSRASLWRWLRKYVAFGAVGLNQPVRADRGRSRWARDNVSLARLTRTLFREGATVAGITRVVRAEAVLRGLRPPCRDTIVFYLARVRETGVRHDIQ
jgi:hypothetical protein